MTPRSALLIAALLLLAPPVRARQREEQCDKNSKRRAEIKYLFELPDARYLLPAEAVKRAGAAILLDETAEVGEGVCLYTTIAQLGDRTAVERFGNTEIWPWFWGRAAIKGRIRHPDGTVYEITDDDIQCADYEERGLLHFGASTPGRYIIHYPGLQAGDLVQQQITAPCDPFDMEWEPQFYGSIQGNHQFIDLWKGTGRAFTLLDGYEITNYPAQLVRYTLLNPRSGTLGFKFYPADLKAEVKEFPGPDHGTVTRISLARPILPREPYAPPFELRSPLAAVTYTGRSFANSEWDKWVNVEANRIYPNMKAAGLADEALGAVAATKRGQVEALARFYRDDSRADLPLYDSLLSVLKARGFNVALVRARSNNSRPIDRSIPTMHWFDRTLLKVDLPEGPLYVSPYHRIAVGSIPEELQGAEAIVIHDRKTWEWTRLPVATAAENRVTTRIEVTEIAGPEVKGRITVTYRGTKADAKRWLRRESTAEQADSALGILDAGKLSDTLAFSNASVSGAENPDQPIVIRADFSGIGLIRRLGPKRQLPALFWHSGPDANDFAASSRSSFVHFGPPASYVHELVLPSGALTPELPAAAPAANGIGRHWERVTEGDVALLRRTFEAAGDQPANEYAALRARLAKLDLEDQLMITLPPEATP